jgi:hypothetical protein
MIVSAAGLAAEEAAVAASAAAATAADPAAAGRVDKASAAQEQRRQQLQAGAAHEYLLVEFALTLLHGWVSGRVHASESVQEPIVVCVKPHA